MSTLSVNTIQNLAGDERFGPVLGTKQASTSGTTIDFSGIPNWVKKITIMFNGVSTDGTDRLSVQIGDAGGIETSGYNGARHNFAASTLAGAGLSGAGFEDNLTGASVVRYGLATLTLMDAATNTWAYDGSLAQSGTTQTRTVGIKALSGTLTQLRITTVSGTDNFDAGEINIMYE